MTLVAIERAAAPTAPRLLPGPALTRLAAHERHYGPLPELALPARLIDVVAAAGLTGRGGAGFPAGRKMRAVADRSGRKTLIANGCEGEPASGKDKALLRRAPHLVLDGVVLAAEAVGATEAFVCVHRRESGLRRTLAVAVAERDARHGHRVRVQVTGTPGRYAASEQSSLVQYLNGGPAKPAFAPPRPHERGVGGRPTLVHNVETLAHIALIARYGDGWFRRAGVPGAPGSALVTVGGAVRRPGVYEIELGTPVGPVIRLAGGLAEPARALLIGGYFGAWLRADQAWRVPMTHAGLRAAGGALGAGVIFALPRTSCPLAETARVVRYLAEESAGQCGPCVFGLPALAGAVEDLAFHGGRGSAADRVRSLAGLVAGRGACRHPDGVAQLVLSMLGAFADDVLRHDRAGPCRGVGQPPLLPVPGDREREWDWQ